MFAKCANPACPTRFDHRLGGKFFRFRRSDGEVSDLPTHNRSHNVMHYWQCARCSQVFSLTYMEGRGVPLKLVGEELAAETKQDQFAAA